MCRGGISELAAWGNQLKAEEVQEWWSGFQIGLEGGRPWRLEQSSLDSIVYLRKVLFLSPSMIE